MVAYANPQHRRKEESEQLRGYVEEWPWWPILSPRSERKKKAKG